MLTYEDALNRVLEDAPQLTHEPVDLGSCVGRVLAEDITAREPIPAFDYSAMDGYAFAFADLSSDERACLPVAGVSRPGAEPLASVKAGTACRIFTGAPVPPPADTVVAQEDVSLDGETIVFSRGARRFQHVRRRGEDLDAGAVAVTRGVRLEARQIGLCAALDLPRVMVARRPRVTVLTTGDELRAPGTPRTPGSVVNGNGPMIRALAEDCGAAVEHRHAADELDAVREEIRRALGSADVLLTIGGISVGSHDHVRDALVAEHVELDFWKVAIKPGKPIAYGRFRDVRVLGLPGNPAAAFVTATLFAAPLLRAMQGDAAARPKWIAARAAHAVSLPDGRVELARSTIDFDDEGQLWVTLPGHQASGSTVGVARANALAWLPPRGGQLAAGAALRVLPLP